ncbi:MAG: hypothetical protein IPJ82_14745 [Lewinellaceae bacterium]|nr:hypothetical protein [Lewinellaceae bacterium]
MKSYIPAWRLIALLFAAATGLFQGQASAQTTLISPTGDGGFENGATFADNGWTLVNGATNQWFVGSVATPSAGTNSAYISDNAGGATYNYINTSASTVHFYRDITFPAGQTNITLSFKWKVQGESSYDYVTVFTIPTSITPAANSPTGAFQSWLNIPTAYPGATILCTPPNLNLQSTYQTQTVCLPASFAGTTQRIVFMWSNDGSAGSQPPGSVDEISLVTSAPPTAPADQPTALLLTPGLNNIAGAFTAAGSAPNGYLVVRTLANVPPAAPADGTTYTPGASALGGIIVSSGATTNFSASGLTPSTPYFFWVYSFNGGLCAGPTYQTAAPLTGMAITNDCSISGTRSVGPTGFYSTLTSAIADLNANGLAGPVILELQSTYLSSAEPAFPIVLPSILCGSSVNTVTIRPEAGAPLLSIAGTNAGPTIDINGGTWWRIDGRPGGVGINKGLVISNSSTTGNAIRFINEGSNNIVRYCDVQGVNTSTTNGVILFSTTTGLNGNDNNLIDNCDVHDGATTPAICIYSSGTSTSQNHFNSSNTVSNCNIFNFFLSTSTSIGIVMTTGSTEWTITGNSFYQTAPRVLAAAQFGSINCPLTTSNKFVITNNFIGGTAPLCGGGPMTLTGSGNFRGMNFTVGPGTTLIQGNTIQNINLTTLNATFFNGGILMGQGNFLCDNNTIGSLTTNGSIACTFSGSAGGFACITAGGTSPTNTTTISNNLIGGISMTVSGAPATPPSVRGISVQGATVASNYIVTGNTIGSTTLANSITGDGNLAGSVIGIVSFSNALGQQITNNTISNLTAPNAGTANIMWGILAQGTSSIGTFTVTGNTIRSLTSGSGATGSGGAASIMGISVLTNLSTVGANNFSQNTVHTLLNNNPTASASVTGMVISLPLLTSNTVARNFLHSYNMTSSTLTGIITGIQLNAGSSNVQNNMVRLGVDATGADITNGYGIFGIREAAGNNNVRFNSVYIGGLDVSAGTSATFAFTSAVTTGTRNYVSNIFHNARSNGAGTGKHYAMTFGGTTPNPVGAASNYNDLLANGTGGFTGLYNAIDQMTLADWRTATGNDFQSIAGDPKFVTPNGNATSVDLHIQAGVATPVEAGGQPVPGVTDDFDGQTRASLTATDIGADAGNFVLSDVSGPGIAYSPIITGCGTGDVSLTGVTITDGTGIPTAGALVPRIYYRKGAGAYFSSPGTFAGGTSTNGTWNFNIVAADLGGIAAGDVISYYVIAQDNLGNIGSNAGGAVATDVNNVTTHPVSPNTFTVQASLSGTRTVGVGGDFATLTAAVAAYNTSCIGGPVVFSLTDATYPGETFPITINANASSSAVNTLTIKPATGVTSAISGSSTTGIIVFNGADWVTIDGSNGNTANTVCPPSAATRDLTITNTGTTTTSAVIWLQTVTANVDGTTNNKIMNCNISGNGPLQTLAGIGMGSATIGTASLGTNNNNNSFINNNISKAQYGVITQGNSAFLKNSGNVINQNLMNTAAPNNLATGGILAGFEDNLTVSGNNISGMAQTSSPDVCGINLGFGHSGFLFSTFAGNEVTNATVTNNIVGSVLNSGTFSAVGIGLISASSGTSTIANNMVSGVAANGTASDFGGGIIIGGGIGSTTRVYYNTVSMSGTLPGATGASTLSIAFGVTGIAPPVLDVRNNIFSNTQLPNTGATVKFFAVGLGYVSSAGNYANLTSDFNDLYVTPGSPRFVGTTGGLNTGITRLTLSNWSTETGRDLNSINYNPSFVSASDLHVVANANGCLDGKGISIAGMTSDIDCQARNASTPDIGADEFTNPDVALNVAETSGLAANDGIICNGAEVTLTAAGGASYTWSTGSGANPLVVSPDATTTYTVTITQSNGCTYVMMTTITVNPVQTLSETHVEPTSCVSADGSINLTVTGTGPFTYNWSTPNGSGIVNGQEDQSGLTVATYFVTVTNSNGCSATTSIALAGPGGCDACPVITSVNANPAGVCVNTSTTITASNLLNMGVTYGITFKSSTVALADPYTSGTVIATIPNGGLGNGGTTAQTTTSFASGNTYFIYAILDQNPTDPNCRPFAQTTLTVVNTPTADAVASQTVCNGSATTAVNFTGPVPGTIFNWTNNIAGIGLAASGSGNIASFTAVNNGGAPVTATITVTPVTSPTTGAVCTGPSTTFTITVNPTAQVNQPANIGTCSASLTTVTFSTTTSGSTFSWTNNNAAIGLGASGTGNISFTAATVLTPTVATITVTPNYTNNGVSCPGASKTFTITVNPVPTVNAVANQTLCSGDLTAAVNFTGAFAGTVFNWTNNNTSIGLAASGTGNIAAFAPVNNSATTQVATITVTPVLTTGGTNCLGVPITFTITVFPRPQVNAGPDFAICQDQSANLSATLGGGATSGTWSGGAGTFSNVNSAATSYKPAVSEYGTSVTLTFTSNDPTGPCPAVSDALILTINTLPIVDAGINAKICPNANLSMSVLGATILANGSGVTTGTWSTTGTGTFLPTNAFPGATTYVPSAADIAAGFVTLSLTSNDPIGPCNSVSDQTLLLFKGPDAAVCNDNVQVSLDPTGTSVITPDMVLEGTYDEDFYTVTVYKNNQPIGNIVDCSHVGQTLQVKITDICTGNFCWGSIKVEDKLSPAMVCTDIHLICAITNYDPAYLQSAFNLQAAYPAVDDNCVQYTLSHIDDWFDQACDDDYSAYVRRVWTAKDASGNTSSCTQYIYFDRKHVGDVLFPTDVTINCSGNVNTNPSSTGAPYVTAFGQQFPIYPSGGFCEMQSAYTDQVLPVCDGTYKIIRTWTVYDWCLPTSPIPPSTNPFYFIQVIKIIDDQGPAIACPANLTVSTNPFDCCASTGLPDVIISDACSRINLASARVVAHDYYTNDIIGTYDVGGTLTDFPGNNLWNPDTLATFALTPCLPRGVHTVTYTVEDACGNSSQCSFALTVDDIVPPSIACDEFTQVALGIDGTALINATTFDDGSFDNCSAVHFKARRMTSDNCQSSDQFHDQVNFCCSDINDTVLVVLRVYDVDVPAGSIGLGFAEENSGDCMVKVFVEDKIKPTCSAPANVTVSCEAFDPSLWAYGTATAEDNCCIDTITESRNYNLFDTLCNRGTITRTFRTFDCAGQQNQCTQRIFVNYEQDYFVKFPNDVIVTKCDGTGNYGEPTFYGKDCELLGVTFEDDVFTVVPDACFKIERTWKIINWCTYNPNGTCVIVPNPNPNATSNSPQNLPGPIVSACGTAAPWNPTIVSIAPGQPQTNFCTFYDPNANCYIYKQIIKVIDTEDPKVSNCPASPVEYCDLTVNDPLLWNQSYWWDPIVGQHDLCEGDAGLTITATDSCSGANVNISYLLFLDLNGDNTMETVISSNNTPAPGTVNFGNAGNPSYTGGTPQVFDGRPVLPNEVYRWALHQSVSGTARTASVQWKTFAQMPTPTNQLGSAGIAPQLPYGTHKIKWTITDGCGNETYCEYTFVVKDCKAPTVVCHNGLSVNIMPTQMVQLWATDFLQYAEDNCTPPTTYTAGPNQLKFAIRKAGTGTDFPEDAQGNPITSVTFTCAELGKKDVELWAEDLAGNADFCLTFVDVQDNNNNCVPSDPNNVTVAGALTTEMSEGVEEANVNLQSGTISKFALSDDQGMYVFPDAVPLGADYTVTPTKDDNPLNGVSTYDLVLISKHILGLEPLTSPYKMIAADANKSNSITTFDIVEIRKLILGIYSELPNNTSWRFVDQDFAFPQPNNPFATQFPKRKTRLTYNSTNWATTSWV